MKKLPYLLTLLIGLSIASCGSDDNDSNAGEESTPLDKATITEILNAHNGYRSDVGIDDLVWSDELALAAQDWAEEWSNTCGDLKHSSNGYGENIFKGTSGAYSPTDVVNTWGSEIDNYTYATNSCADGKACGHYTQIVWDASTEVGCAMVTCSGNDFWICNYNPPGNFKGEKPY